MSRLTRLSMGLLALCFIGAAKPGMRAEDFALRDQQGRLVRLSALSGKVVLVDFWASWCEPCKQELPLLAGMSERLRGRGVEILAINIDRDSRKAQAFLKARKLGPLTVLFNPDLTVADKYAPPKMPTSFVIDKKGLIRHVNSGFEPGDEKKIEQQLTSLLGS